MRLADGCPRPPDQPFRTIADSEARAVITFYDSRHPQIVAYLEVDVPVLPRLGTLMAEAGVALSDYWVFFGVKPLRTCHTPSRDGGWN